MSGPAILQFGTGRLLQAHADLMVSEALGRGEAIGTIAAVQTTGSAEARCRVAALKAGGGFPVRIRGLDGGRPVEAELCVTSVAQAFEAATEWDAIEALAVEGASAIVSNTADRGYELDPGDRPEHRVPRSFPAKLVKLLHARWRHRAEPVTLFPLELISRNGEVLRGVVDGLAAEWSLEPAFREWLRHRCIWACSLVDRIVSEAIDPVGAVAEPYALWAIEAAPGLRPICRHPDLVVTDDLARYERLKLYILNLGHTWLAERWLLEGRPEDETVREALADPDLAASLEALYAEEVLPVFAALGLGEAAASYRDTTLERFRNPFLRHHLRDIAQNHATKKERRFKALIDLARQIAPGSAQPRLRAALISNAESRA
ncbi:MAG: mannitol dehydrogenase family protein [Geminicoccaceae bacterium]